MAYNPSLYNPYGQQPYQWSQAWQRPINGLVSVTGMEGAKAYQMPPNSSMPLFDADEDLLYVKTTDAAGYPTIRTFAFKPTEQPKQDAEPAYITREDFDAFAAKIEGLVGKAAQDGK